MEALLSAIYTAFKAVYLTIGTGARVVLKGLVPNVLVTPNNGVPYQLKILTQNRVPGGGPNGLEMASK